MIHLLQSFFSCGISLILSTLYIQSQWGRRLKVFMEMILNLCNGINWHVFISSKNAPFSFGAKYEENSGLHTCSQMCVFTCSFEFLNGKNSWIVKIIVISRTTESAILQCAFWKEPSVISELFWYHFISKQPDGSQQNRDKEWEHKPLNRSRMWGCGHLHIGNLCAYEHIIVKEKVESYIKWQQF